MGEVFCERFRLSWRHGGVPTDAAVKRMTDSLETQRDKADVERMENRLHSMSAEEQATLGISPRKIQYKLHEYSGGPAAPEAAPPGREEE